MNDLELLRQYDRKGCEDSFAELVHRHLNLVYSVAARQVQSPQLAEEITQTVFMILARNAAKMKPDTILTAWLYRVTRRVAINLGRAESRRRVREQTAQDMAGLDTDSADWAKIEPLLDEAMEQLDDLDRSAILLRFFEDKSLREVGQILGTSEDAARKRISRAVEQLRVCFSASGVAVSSAGLCVILSANAVGAAPVGLGAAICASPMLGGIHSSATVTIAKTIAMTTTQKVLLTASLAALAVGAGIHESHVVSGLRSQLQAAREQQDPLAADLQDARRQRDAAANQLQLAENQIQQLRRDAAEVPKLRGELARLRNAATSLAQSKAANSRQDNDPTESMAKAWAAQVKQLKQRLDQWPARKIPELQLVTDQDWFDAVGQSNSLESDADFRQALDRLRRTAKNKFAPMVQDAFKKYTDANDGQLPADLSQLQPFLDPSVDGAMLQRYQLLQTGKLGDVPPNQPLITESAAVDDQFDTRYFIMINGTAVANW
jgi:RNA polymerase sigma factor (sigma-70 family)